MKHKGSQIKLEKARQNRHYFVSISQVLHDIKDKSRNCIEYPNENYSSYNECDARFTKRTYQANFKNKNCRKSSEDIVPLFSTRNFSEVLGNINCSLSTSELNGLYRGTSTSPCLTPCQITFTNTVLASVEENHQDSIHITFDNKVLIKNITLDRFKLMETMNFFGSNLGLWPGLGIFQMIEWVFENILWQMSLCKIIKRKK